MPLPLATPAPYCNRTTSNLMATALVCIVYMSTRAHECREQCCRFCDNPILFKSVQKEVQGGATDIAVFDGISQLETNTCQHCNITVSYMYSCTVISEPWELLSKNIPDTLPQPSLRKVNLLPGKLGMLSPLTSGLDLLTFTSPGLRPIIQNSS